MNENYLKRILKFLGVSAMGLLLVPALALSANEADRSPSSVEESVEVEEGNASLYEQQEESRDPQSVPATDEAKDPMGEDSAAQIEVPEPVQGEGQAQVQDRPQTQAVTIRLNQTEVRQIQERLKDLGHYEAQIDGLWGPRTESAVQAFQQAQGLDTTGEINLRTLSALNVFGVSERTPASLPSESDTQTQQQSPQPRGESDRAIDSELEQPEVEVQDTESY